MIKKIKDLTEQEVSNICDQYALFECQYCPLNIKHKNYCKSEVKEKYGNEEIELEESNQSKD